MVLVAVLVVLVWATIKSSRKRSSNAGVYIKIGMNHIQLLVLTSTLNLDWPPQVQSMFNALKPVSSIDSELISLDCFFETRTSVEDKYLFSPYFFKMILYTFIPLITILCTALFWWTFFYCYKR